MIELKNISTGYGRKTVLNNLSASFEKGKLTSIIGINGCGKSTLLKSILGILPLSCGEISIDEKNLQAINRNEIAKKVSYLAQGKTIPDMTVEQMVLYGRFPHLSYPRHFKEIDREIAKNAMDMVGITHLAKKPMSELSGGMRQTAFIAMALAQDTDYILLDEPTTYLDISHQLDLMKLLKKLADSGKGIVTIMHDLPLAFDFSDAITIINNGTVIASNTPEEISSLPLLKEIFGTEVKSTDNKFHYVY